MSHQIAAEAGHGLRDLAADRPEPLGVSAVVDGARTLVVLEGVNDPENLGAIFRNCAALGVDVSAEAVRMTQLRGGRAVRGDRGECHADGEHRQSCHDPAHPVGIVDPTAE